MVVATATFMEVLDTTIANVALPYIAGGLGVSEDEASWVVTTYLVANAISLTASTFLVRRLGRRKFFIACLALFTVSSVLCAFAWNLQALLLFRVLQGIAGGGMVPVSQSILVDSFPPAKRGQAFALFGVAVVVAPVVGPTLGGWLSDNVSWHWCFLINGPVGLLTIASIAMLLRETRAQVEERQRLRRTDGGFDLVGFALVATFLGALEIMCDRGLEDDWFGSGFIVGVAGLCALAFVLMIPWEMTRRNPTIDIRMVATRQFGASFLVMLATGAILLATTQFLPQLVQQDLGYTATWAGLVLSPGGVVTMAMMFITGRLLTKIQPKYLIVAGASVIALSMYNLTSIYTDVGFSVPRPVAHAAGRRPAADLPVDHRRVLRRHSARQDRPGIGADQHGAQHRRLAGRRACRPTCWPTASSSTRAASWNTPCRRAPRTRRRCAGWSNTSPATAARRCRPRSRRSPGSASRSCRRPRSWPSSTSSGR